MLAIRNVSSATATLLASPVEHSLDALPVLVSRPKLSRAQSGHLSVASSKTVVFECCVTSNTRRVLCPSLVAREISVALRRVQGCNGPRHSRNRDSDRRHCAAAGICRRRSVGREESPTASSLPKWTLSARRERANWDSSLMDVTEDQSQFKRHLAISPLTLTLSPLREEGNRSGSRSKLRPVTCSRDTLIIPQ